MKTGRKFYIYFLFALAETLALVWFSLLQSAGFVQTGGFLRLGDLEHFLAYAVYGFLWQRVFLNRHIATKGSRGPALIFGIFLPLAIGSLVGAFCETMQFFVPTRVADPMDWAVDTLGSFCGAAAASKLRNLF